MSLAGITGNVRNAACEGCGKVVFQREILIASGPARGTSYWDHDMHDAECGLPCALGGLRTAVLSSKQFHGSNRFPCPACGQQREEKK